MPTYEYACRDCGEHLEVVQSFKDAPLTVCGSCGGSLRKVFSAAGIIFKGSGYYVTDTRGDQGGKGKGAKAPAASDAGGGSGDSGDSGGASGDGGSSTGGDSAKTEGKGKSAAKDGGSSSAAKSA